MSLYIAEAIGDYDRKPGDSGGNEVRRCSWWRYTTLNYTRAFIYRHPDENVRNAIMMAAIEIAKNDNIGYSQERRTTSYNAFAGTGWNIDAISSIGKCDIDCSEMMACCVNFAFENSVLSSSTWTGDLGGKLEKKGFDRLGWTNSFELLKPGDIMLVHHDSFRTGHTGMVIGNDINGEWYDMMSWNDTFGPDEVPAWQLLYWGWKHASTATDKCDKILAKLEEFEEKGIPVGTVKVDVEDLQSSMKKVLNNTKLNVK